MVGGVEMNIEDTGNRRRATDKVSTDRALELIASLAMENALAKGDDAVIASVEQAVLKLRELKVQTTGVYPVLTPEDIEREWR
jgi:hypothetical protein